MTPFSSSERFLSGLSSEATGKLVAAAADVALIVDAQGVIRDLSFGSESLKNLGYENWIGQKLSETVAKDSLHKIEALLKDAVSSEAPRWRQVNHESATGPRLPLSYCAVKVDGPSQAAVGYSVMFGRDLRPMAALQQNLVDMQQASVQEHWRLRDAQSRFRHLFSTTTEAILLVDADSQKVHEANPAAVQLLDGVVRKLQGASFPCGFDERGHKALLAMLGSLRLSGKADDVRAQLIDGHGELTVSGSVLREESGPLMVLRLARSAAARPTARRPRCPPRTWRPRPQTRA